MRGFSFNPEFLRVCIFTLMKIQFWSIGKSHDSHLAPVIEDYTRRINKYFPAQWHIIPPPKNAAALPEQELKKKEGEIILQQLAKEDFLMALDEKGRSMNSVKFANFIEARTADNTKQLIFLIGGAYGLYESVTRRANLVWSLSDLTFPHQLVRLVLAEQVYRACTIMRNEKYHHA